VEAEGSAGVMNITGQPANPILADTRPEDKSCQDQDDAGDDKLFS